MKLFLDENHGRRIPEALRALEFPAESIEYPRRDAPVGLGTPDVEWLRWVGDHGYLALSQDERILQVPHEFGALPQHRVGIVFVRAGNLLKWETFRLISWKWDWLQLIDRAARRPFAFELGPGAATRQYDLGRGPGRWFEP